MFLSKLRVNFRERAESPRFHIVDPRLDRHQIIRLALQRCDRRSQDVVFCLKMAPLKMCLNSLTDVGRKWIRHHFLLGMADDRTLADYQP